MRRRCSRATRDGRRESLPGGLAPGEYVVVHAQDNGVGIPPQLLDKIFDPFFTTKEAGKGTGLGLSTTKRIVEEHGGRIHVLSEPGRGTSFSVFLPLPVEIHHTP